MSTIITEPTTAHESTCPPWCTRAGTSDHTDGGDFRAHCTDEDYRYFENEHGLTNVRSSVGVCVVAEETPNEGSTTVLTQPLVWLAVGDDKALLTVEQLMTVSAMCARAAVVLGKVERGESL